jgi:thiol:disulfide interchange protein/DsbC/DsbD-like thiol-disulfide interchange protein
MKRLVLPLLTLLLAATLQAQPVKAPHVEAELISDVSTFQPGVPFKVALKLTLDPHWHVYWQNPGDSGIPPKVIWDLPEGFQVTPIQWPYPERIEVGPLVNFGYQGTVLFVQEILPPDSFKPGTKLTLKAKAKWLVCEDVCIPGSADLQLRLVSGPKPVPNAGSAVYIQDIMGRLPVELPDIKLSAYASDKEWILRGPAPAPTALVFFPEQEGLIENAGAQTLTSGTAGFELRIPRAADSMPKDGRLSGLLVSPEGWGPKHTRALKFNVPINEGPAPVFTKSPAVPGEIFFYALLGGLILNIMPCVFPVLSIKAIGLVQHAGENPGEIRRQGLFFGLGVILSFWVLAGLLLGLRAGGTALGWGFQLQSPGFVLTLLVLFFLMALVLLGVFEIGTSLIGLGAKGQGGNPDAGAFFSGVVATVAATPCTAPFMGAAVGVALGQSLPVALGIFTAMAIGMAAPFVLISWVPGLAKCLPRPGAWMESFKQFMAFPLFGTVVWLLWVFASQRGINSAALVLFALLVLGMAAWAYGRWFTPVASELTRIGTGFAVLLLAAVSIFLFSQSLSGAASTSAGTAGSSQEEHGVTWVPYSKEKLEALRQEGKVVYLDFTATWCITCQVNKGVVFSSGDVLAFFKEPNVVAMKGDWTNYDPAITAALQSFGRAGVPLNVVYGPGLKEPLVLPSVLTPGMVLDALQKAKGH